MSLDSNPFIVTPEHGLRVLFVCASLELGGAERQLSLLAPALRSRNFDPAIVTIRAKGPLFDELRQEGIPTYFLPVASRFDLRGVRNVVRTVESWPEVVVSQGLDAQLVAHFVARHAGVPHLTVHHVSPDLAMAPHRRLLTAIVARKVDCAVAVTTAQVENMVSLGFRSDHIRVIPNGASEPRDLRERASTRTELGLAETDFVALFAGRLRSEKRVDVFIENVKTAHAHNARIRGVIAGGGPGLELGRSQVGTSAAISLLGERTDVPDLIVASDVVCLTSDAEALPMVIIEAMAVGRPVIATNVGGVPDLVLDGITGTIIDVDQGGGLSQALCRLVDDPGVVHAMGVAGKLRYERGFTLDAMTERYAALLHEFATAARRPVET